MGACGFQIWPPWGVLADCLGPEATEQPGQHYGGGGTVQEQLHQQNVPLPGSLGLCIRHFPKSGARPLGSLEPEVLGSHQMFRVTHPSLRLSPFQEVIGLTGGKRGLSLKLSSQGPKDWLSHRCPH